MRTRTIYLILCFTLLLSIPSMVIAAEGLRERAYLQTDKQVYLSGELLWMKLYLTDTEGKPCPFSKVGYVELLEENTARVQVKLDVKNAVGEGWMEIPSSLPTGYYRLVAYTRNMKNEGEEVFFHRTIAVINTFRKDETISIDSLTQLPEQSLLDNTLSVLAERSNYPVRTQSYVEIKGLPRNVHSLSISIAGKDFTVAGDDVNISRWHKDLVALPKPAFSKLFTPEYEGHIIQGRIVQAKTDEPISDEVVFPLLGFVGDQIRLFGGKQSENGKVEFFTTRIKGTRELASTNFTPLGELFRVNIETPFSVHSQPSLPLFTMNPAWEKELTDRSMSLQVAHAYMADSLSRIDTTYSYFQWKPDRSYILDEYTRFTRMDEVVIEFIPSLRFRSFNGKRLLSVLEEEGNMFSVGNSLVMLDGIPITDHELIYKYDPLLIYKIDVYKSKFVFGTQYFSGLVMITTYNKDYPTLVLTDDTQIYDYEGTQAYRHFYAPSYTDESARTSSVPDFRHTLLWQPVIQPVGDTTLRIPFSTSDLEGEFTVTVEGLTIEGSPVRGVTSFTVR